MVVWVRVGISIFSLQWSGKKQLKRGAQWVFWDTRFPLFEAQDSGFKSKIRASFGVESMRGRWDAKYNPRDHGIARNFGYPLKMVSAIFTVVVVEILIYPTEQDLNKGFKES